MTAVGYDGSTGGQLGAVADAAPPEDARSFRRTVAGLAVFAGVLVFFLTQTRLPATLLKFETIERAQSGRGRSTFGQVVDPETFAAPFRWIAYGINLWDANAIGMFFAVLLGGAALGAFAPGAKLRRLATRRGAPGAGVGGLLGLPLFMCSACSAPVSMGLYRGGAAPETSLGMILGSALFNPVGVVAVFLVLPAEMGVARVVFGLLAIFVLAPLAARAAARPALASSAAAAAACAVPLPAPSTDPDVPWTRAIASAVRDWVTNSTDVAVRLVPPMLLATLLVGVAFTFIPPQELSERVGSGIAAILVAALLGTLLQLPTLFEIPLVLGVMALGLGAGPATALLVTAPSVGLVTLAITRADLGWRVPLIMLAGTFGGGALAGLLVGSL